MWSRIRHRVEFSAQCVMQLTRFLLLSGLKAEALGCAGPSVGHMVHVPSLVAPCAGCSCEANMEIFPTVFFAALIGALLCVTASNFWDKV